MPRAYYKPFTAYEEAVGFHAARRNAYILVALFGGGIIFKIILAHQFGSGHTVRIEDPAYQRMLAHQAATLRDTYSPAGMRTTGHSQSVPPIA